MRAYPGDGIKLYGVAFLYNIAQVMLCSYMCIEAVIVAKRSNFNLVCNSYDAKHPPMANVLWLFYASKVLDFVDTFFIVIGKKWKQLSFLHVYHHTTIFLFYWLNGRVNFDGDIYLTIVLNGLIHTIMYTYFLAATFGYRSPLAQSLTTMQMIQFLTGITMTLGVHWMGESCDNEASRWTLVFIQIYAVGLVLLFGAFYKKKYKKD